MSFIISVILSSVLGIFITSPWWIVALFIVLSTIGFHMIFYGMGRENKKTLLSALIAFAFVYYGNYGIGNQLFTGFVFDKFHELISIVNLQIIYEFEIGFSLVSFLILTIVIRLIFCINIAVILIGSSAVFTAIALIPSVSWFSNELLMLLLLAPIVFFFATTNNIMGGYDGDWIRQSERQRQFLEEQRQFTDQQHRFMDQQHHQTQQFTNQQHSSMHQQHTDHNHHNNFFQLITRSNFSMSPYKKGIIFIISSYFACGRP